MTGHMRGDARKRHAATADPIEAARRDAAIEALWDAARHLPATDDPAAWLRQLAEETT